MRSRSSFSLAIRLLPVEQRSAVLTLYRWCRAVDDAVDDAQTPQQAEQALAVHAEELERVFAGCPASELGCQLNQLLCRYALRQEYFLAMLDGMRCDMAAVQLVTESDLSRYCYQVAGVVGLMLIEVFGYRHAETRHFAVLLGEAVQRTNILRDIHEDAQRGRIYLPREAWQGLGVCADDFQTRTPGAALRRYLLQEADRVAVSYQQAWSLLPAEDKKNQLGSLLLGRSYALLLSRLRRQGFVDLGQRPVLSRWRLLFALLACYGQVKLSSDVV